MLRKFFDGNKIFASTALAYRLYGKLNGAPLGYAVALLANIRGNRKKIFETNTLAYFVSPLVMIKKSFKAMTQGGAQVPLKVGRVSFFALEQVSKL